MDLRRSCNFHQYNTFVDREARETRFRAALLHTSIFLYIIQTIAGLHVYTQLIMLRLKYFIADGHYFGFRRDRTFQIE